VATAFKQGLCYALRNKEEKIKRKIQEFMDEISNVTPLFMPS
jgi:hypothetical protein